MMARFYGYIDKVFEFRARMARLVDSRPKPLIPTTAVFGTAFAMFATCRGSPRGALGAQCGHRGAGLRPIG